MAARLSSLAEVAKLLSKLLAKHYSLDPVLTWLVKRLTDYLAPVICHLSSLQHVTAVTQSSCQPEARHCSVTTQESDDE